MDRKPERRMTGSAAAIAARDRYRAAADDCKLAYGLERQFGRVCSRRGGRAVCGLCLRDLRPEEATRVTQPLKGKQC